MMMIEGCAGTSPATRIAVMRHTPGRQCDRFDLDLPLGDNGWFQIGGCFDVGLDDLLRVASCELLSRGDYHDDEMTITTSMRTKRRRARRRRMMVMMTMMMMMT
jgi:hypothetical protein